jgi:hypothetical protein
VYCGAGGSGNGTRDLPSAEWRAERPATMHNTPTYQPYARYCRYFHLQISDNQGTGPGAADVATTSRGVRAHGGDDERTRPRTSTYSQAPQQPYQPSTSRPGGPKFLVPSPPSPTPPKVFCSFPSNQRECGSHPRRRLQTHPLLSRAEQSTKHHHNIIPL